MSFADAYLKKVSLDPSIDRQPPGKELAIVVAIPACNEPDILKPLISATTVKMDSGSWFPMCPVYRTGLPVREWHEK
jgi:hypothetical protein